MKKLIMAIVAASFVTAPIAQASSVQCDSVVSCRGLAESIYAQSQELNEENAELRQQVENAEHRAEVAAERSHKLLATNQHYVNELKKWKKWLAYWQPEAQRLQKVIKAKDNQIEKLIDLAQRMLRTINNWAPWEYHHHANRLRAIT